MVAGESRASGGLPQTEQGPHSAAAKGGRPGNVEVVPGAVSGRPSGARGLRINHLASRPVSAPDHVRHEWEESARRLEASAGDRVRYAALLGQLEIVTAELRKRVRQT